MSCGYENELGIGIVKGLELEKSRRQGLIDNLLRFRLAARPNLLGLGFCSGHNFKGIPFALGLFPGNGGILDRKSVV